VQPRVVVAIVPHLHIAQLPRRDARRPYNFHDKTGVKGGLGACGIPRASHNTRF
jgi:hypothetical protein